MKTPSNPTPEKLSKRGLKSLKGPNAATLRSIQEGETIIVGDRKYAGKTPEFVDVTAGSPMSPPHYVKVGTGIPFVRVPV